MAEHWPGIGDLPRAESFIVRHGIFDREQATSVRLLGDVAGQNLLPLATLYPSGQPTVEQTGLQSAYEEIALLTLLTTADKLYRLINAEQVMAETLFAVEIRHAGDGNAGRDLLRGMQVMRFSQQDLKLVGAHVPDPKLVLMPFQFEHLKRQVGKGGFDICKGSLDR